MLGAKARHQGTVGFSVSYMRALLGGFGEVVRIRHRVRFGISYRPTGLGLVTGLQWRCECCEFHSSRMVMVLVS